MDSTTINSITTSSTTMSSATINSTTPTEFLSFSKLPIELRQMVWNEALPTLDMQRFRAEIAPHPNSLPSNKSEDLVLCLTPHDDFVQLTSGYRGLLGACRESQWAVTDKIKYYLPINYIASHGNNSVAVRSARVPFNPDGQLCISGLRPALHNASDGFGARDMDLPAPYWPEDLAEEIQCTTLAGIKHLTIALDPPRISECSRMFMLGWCHRAFDILAKRMGQLETVALIDEGVLNERHPKDFRWLHTPMPVVRPSEDGDGWDYDLDEPSTIKIPWMKLYYEFKSSLSTFLAIKKLRARRIGGL
jgi:hypothetical protein